MDRIVWGKSEDGKRALVVVTPETGREPYVAIYPVVGEHLASSGRWECSPAHLVTYADLYRSRFPR